MPGMSILCDQGSGISVAYSHKFLIIGYWLLFYVLNFCTTITVCCVTHFSVRNNTGQLLCKKATAHREAPIPDP